MGDILVVVAHNVFIRYKFVFNIQNDTIYLSAKQQSYLFVLFCVLNNRLFRFKIFGVLGILKNSKMDRNSEWKNMFWNRIVFSVLKTFIDFVFKTCIRVFVISHRATRANALKKHPNVFKQMVYSILSFNSCILPPDLLYLLNLNRFHRLKKSVWGTGFRHIIFVFLHNAKIVQFSYSRSNTRL